MIRLRISHQRYQWSKAKIVLIAQLTCRISPTRPTARADPREYTASTRSTGSPWPSTTGTNSFLPLPPPPFHVWPIPPLPPKAFAWGGIKIRFDTFFVPVFFIRVDTYIIPKIRCWLLDTDIKFLNTDTDSLYKYKYIVLDHICFVIALILPQWFRFVHRRWRKIHRTAWSG